MEQKELIIDGNSKKVFATDDPDKVIIHYTDMANAYHYIKKAVIRRKGLATCKISALVYNYLRQNGIESHFIEQAGDRDLLCKKVKFIPMKVIVRNIAAGTMAERLGLNEGACLFRPVFELCYKNKTLGDPLINNGHAAALGLASYEELDEIHSQTARINELLVDLFKKAGIDLVDFKIEFGYDTEGNLVLADEISPDTCRLWDSETGEKLDKDRFRKDLDNVIEAYDEVLDRLTKIIG